MWRTFKSILSAEEISRKQKIINHKLWGCSRPSQNIEIHLGSPPVMNKTWHKFLLLKSPSSVRILREPGAHVAMMLPNYLTKLFSWRKAKARRREMWISDRKHTKNVVGDSRVETDRQQSDIQPKPDAMKRTEFRSNRFSSRITRNLFYHFLFHRFSDYITSNSHVP